MENESNHVRADADVLRQYGESRSSKAGGVFSSMQSTIADQMKLAADLQTLMPKQMQQLLDSLQGAMTRFAGGGEEGKNGKP